MPPTVMVSGVSLRQRSLVWGQRGWKLQPETGARDDAGRPGQVLREFSG